ncbi:hypothetical protein ISS37_05790 [candidate division KSB1 bacterium]|nr:hypothetical protein [candidate division KSB1 bacterium]
MRKILPVTVILAFFAFFWGGCSESTQEEVDDEAAITELVEGLLADDSLNIFYDEGIVDDEAVEPEFEDSTLEKGIGGAQLDSAILTVRFGRRGQIRRESISVEVQGDTAYVTLVRSFNGQFLIVAVDTVDSHFVFQKDMYNHLTRRLRFVRVGNSPNPRENWAFRGVSLSEDFSVDPNPNQVEILHLEIYRCREGDPDSLLLSVDDPLNTFLPPRFGVPRFFWRDTVKVFVIMADTDPKVGLLHYRHSPRFRARRRLNDAGFYPDAIAGDGIYSGLWEVRRMGRFYARFDFLDHRTVYDDTEPYDSNIWGVPYRVVHFP